ncbi:DUF805 domain-containing protein, partial [Shigella sonnei]
LSEHKTLSISWSHYPFIGWLIIIVFNCQAGTPGENRFGPDPKLEP